MSGCRTADQHTADRGHMLASAVDCKVTTHPRFPGQSFISGTCLGFVLGLIFSDILDIFWIYYGSQNSVCENHC